ncbi:hypothetical protein [Chryseobacterium sp. JAH]|nr:hypothetical protein [Chryseobacterium sp. JAH]
MRTLFSISTEFEQSVADFPYLKVLINYWLSLGNTSNKDLPKTE